MNNILKEDELAREFTRPHEPLTLPFKPVRRLVAAATDILRRKKNVFIVGGLDPKRISPVLEDSQGNETDNPDFSPEACFEITRPTAEVIVLLTCEESHLIACMGNPDLLDQSVNKLLIDHTDTDIIGQVPIVFEAISGIGASTAEVEDTGEESDSLDPEKKTPPAHTG